MGSQPNHQLAAEPEVRWIIMQQPLGGLMVQLVMPKSKSLLLLQVARNPRASKNSMQTLSMMTKMVKTMMRKRKRSRKTRSPRITTNQGAIKVDHPKEKYLLSRAKKALNLTNSQLKPLLEFHQSQNRKWQQQLQQHPLLLKTMRIILKHLEWMFLVSSSTLPSKRKKSPSLKSSRNKALSCLTTPRTRWKVRSMLLTSKDKTSKALRSSRKNFMALRKTLAITRGLHLQMAEDCKLLQIRWLRSPKAITSWWVNSSAEMMRSPKIWLWKKNLKSTVWSKRKIKKMKSMKNQKRKSLRNLNNNSSNSNNKKTRKKEAKTIVQLSKYRALRALKVEDNKVNSIRVIKLQEAIKKAQKEATWWQVQVEWQVMALEDQRREAKKWILPVVLETWTALIRDTNH